MEEPPALSQNVTSYEVEAADAVAGLLVRDFRRAPLCVVSLAMAVQMTPYQLSRCFRRRFGMSMEAYVEFLRQTPAWGRQWVMLAI